MRLRLATAIALTLPVLGPAVALGRFISLQVAVGIGFRNPDSQAGQLLAKHPLLVPAVHLGENAIQAGTAVLLSGLVLLAVLGYLKWRRLLFVWGWALPFAATGMTIADYYNSLHASGMGFLVSVGVVGLTLGVAAFASTQVQTDPVPAPAPQLESAEEQPDRVRSLRSLWRPASNG